MNAQGYITAREAAEMNLFTAQLNLQHAVASGHPEQIRKWKKAVKAYKAEVKRHTSKRGWINNQ